VLGCRIEEKLQVPSTDMINDCDGIDFFDHSRLLHFANEEAARRACTGIEME
jgi:hypothetical protein